MSKPTQRQKQQRMFELVKQREELRQVVNDWRRELARVEREMRRLVNK